MQQGFDVFCYAPTQQLERTLGVDALFYGDFVKMFGLQHKVLYHSTSEDYWPLTPSHQLETLRQTSWAYYCLSDVTGLRDRRRALSLARFVKPKEFDAGDRQASRSGDFFYTRWGVFQSMIHDCRRGELIASREELAAVMDGSAEAIQLIDTLIFMSWDISQAAEVVPVGAVIVDRVMPGLGPEEGRDGDGLR